MQRMIDAVEVGLIGAAMFVMTGCAFDVGSTKYLKVTGSVCAESDILPFDCKADGVKVEAMTGAEE